MSLIFTELNHIFHRVAFWSANEKFLKSVDNFFIHESSSMGESSTSLVQDSQFCRSFHEIPMGLRSGMDNFLCAFTLSKLPQDPGRYFDFLFIESSNDEASCESYLKHQLTQEERELPVVCLNEHSGEESFRRKAFDRWLHSNFKKHTSINKLNSENFFDSLRWALSWSR